MVLRSGPTPGKVFPLEKNELFIGRDLSNDVVINDPEISRRHTRLFQQSGTYAVEDLGSTNGTSINGQRLTGPALLTPGDVLTLGERVTLFFEAMPGAINAPVPMPDLPAPGFNQPGEPAYPAQYPPAYAEPRPSYTPPPPAQPTYRAIDQLPAGYPGEQPPFSGQLPLVPGAAEPEAPQAKAPIWPYIVIGLLLVIVIILIIDDFRLWCLFGLC
jgi:predicted component of type VI protein secretion system